MEFILHLAMLLTVVVLGSSYGRILPVWAYTECSETVELTRARKRRSWRDWMGVSIVNVFVSDILIVLGCPGEARNTRPYAIRYKEKGD